MATAWADPNATAPYDVSTLKIGWINDFAAKVGPECLSAFTSNVSFAEVDDWIKGYPDQAHQIVEDGSPGLMTNTDWCKLHTGPMISSMVQGVSYMPPNCPKQPKPGSPYTYRCTTLVAYANCYALKGLNLDSHATNPCGMNVPMVGESAAQTLPVVCSAHVADYAPNTDVPVEIDCPSASVLSCGKSQMYSKLPQQLLSIQVKPDPWYAALKAKVDGVVWLVSHGQDPHGTPPPPEKISTRDNTAIKLNDMSAANFHVPVDQNTGPVKDTVAGTGHTELTNRQPINPDLLPGEQREASGMKTTGTMSQSAADARAAQITNDQFTGKVPAPKPGTALKTGLTAPVACENRIQVSDIDPLIVYTEPCVFQSLQSNTNQDFGFKDKNGKPLKWYYPDYFNDMNRLMQDEHPSSCSAVNAPVLFVAFQPTGSEAAFTNAGKGMQTERLDKDSNGQGQSAPAPSANPASPLPFRPGQFNNSNQQPGGVPITMPSSNANPAPTRQIQPNGGEAANNQNQPNAKVLPGVASRLPNLVANDGGITSLPGRIREIAPPAPAAAANTPMELPPGAAAPLCPNQPPDTKDVIDNFKMSDANWHGLPPPMEPQPACNCDDLYNQRSATLIKQGEEVLQALTSCKLTPENTIKAKDGLANITNQLHQNRFQRNALVTNYQTKMRGSMRP